jgi:hypothetical protein
MLVEEYLRHSLIEKVKWMAGDCRRHHDRLAEFPDEAWADLDYDQLQTVNEAIECCEVLISLLIKNT